MARNIKNILLKSSTDAGVTWLTHIVQEVPIIAPETVKEEDATAFGDEYVSYLPTIKDRDLLDVKVRDDGEGTVAGLALGCQMKWQLEVTFSDRSCAAESVVTKKKEFTAYIQKRSSENIEVDGKRVAVILIALRLTSAFTDVVAP